MNRVASVVASVALLVALIGVPGAAAADGSSPSAALPINGTMTGTLSPGQTVWYSISYPGGNVPLGLTLQYNPSDTPTAGSVNFAVDWSTAQGEYNADWPGLYRIGLGTSNGLPNGTSYWYSGSGNGATYNVRVFNASSVTVGYALASTGSAFPPPWLNPPWPSTQTGPSAPTPTPGPGSGASAESGVPISAANPTVSDTLVGITSGATRFYSFAYPGGNVPVQITLNFSPGYGTTGNQGFGFNVYGPNGLTLAGVPNATGDPSTTQLVINYPATATMAIQVFNYSNGVSVSYTLTLSGITGGGTTVVGGKSNSTPEQAVPINTINATIGGTIVGPENGQGAAQFYTVSYPGGNVPMTLTMNGTPVYTGQGQAWGFHVYCTTLGGSASTTTVNGYPISQSNISAQYSTTIVQQSAATCLVQAFNFWPGTPVSYTIDVTGAAGPAPRVSGNDDSSRAVVLNSARPGATASLTDNAQGVAQYYLINYPGNGSLLTVAVTYTSTGGAPDNALGFTVYDGSTLLATVTPNDDGTGTHSAVWFYSGSDAKTFGIQVSNWAPGTTVSYVIHQVGSK